MDNNYQLSRIHNYINGLMSKEEMHALEREALNDPFLQDAIDGYALQRGVDAKQLSLLQKRLGSRVQQQVDGRNRRFFGWQRLAVGAAAAVMFVTVCMLMLLKYIPQNRSSALAEVEIMQEHTYKVELVRSPSEGAPADGWDSYQQYIDQHFNNATQREGVIHLTFDISESGEPIGILEETDYGSIEAPAELKQIVANGPKWEGRHGRLSLEIKKTSDER